MDGKVTISTALDTSGLRKGLKNVSGSLGGLSGVLGKLGGVVASVFSVAKIVQFGAKCVELGSDLTEVQNVVDTAFGSMAYKMEAFADTAVTSFGMSELSAKQTGSTYMAMARGMGLAEDAASDMAIALTGLSGDVASFYNLDQSEAATKLNSVFTGETETLKSLGVVMTQTNLNAYALANGYGKTTSAMNQAELVALRYAYVTDALNLASGDFVKTQDSWANQTRILSMQWQQFMASIGQTLTTVLLPVVKTLNTIVSALISAANTVNSVVQSLFGGSGKQLEATNSSIGSSAAAAATGENALADATTAAGKAAKGALAGFDKLDVLQQDTGSSAGISAGSAGGSTIAAVDTAPVEGVSDKVQALADKFSAFLAPLKEIDLQPLCAAFERLKNALDPITDAIFAGLEWAWFNLLVPLAGWTIEDAIPNFLDVLSAALGVLSEIINALKPLGDWLWQNFLRPMAEFAGDAVTTFLQILANKLTAVSDWISENQTLVQTMAIIIGAFALAWGLVNVAVGLWNGIGVIAAGVTTAFGIAVQVLTSPITLVVLAIGALIAVGVLLVKNWDTISESICSAWNAIVDGIKGAINGVIGFINGMMSAVTNGINCVIDALNCLHVDIPDWVPLLGGKSFGFNIQPLTAPQIPLLAQGAVIPANKPFLAMLGDQRDGTNVETPLETIKQALVEAMGQQGGSGGDIILQIDGNTLARIMAPYLSKEGNRTGMKIITGGAF